MTPIEIFKMAALVLAGVGAFLIGFKLMSDNLEKLFGSSLKLLFNKTSDKRLVNVGMGAAVCAYFVACGGDFFHIFRVSFHPKLYGEKGATDIVFLHRVEQLIGELHTPSAVETDGNFFLLSCHRIDG